MGKLVGKPQNANGNKTKKATSASRATSPAATAPAAAAAASDAQGPNTTEPKTRFMAHGPLVPATPTALDHSHLVVTLQQVQCILYLMTAIDLASMLQPMAQPVYQLAHFTKPTPESEALCEAGVTAHGITLHLCTRYNMNCNKLKCPMAPLPDTICKNYVTHGRCNFFEKGTCKADKHLILLRFNNVPYLCEVTEANPEDVTSRRIVQKMKNNTLDDFFERRRQQQAKDVLSYTDEVERKKHELKAFAMVPAVNAELVQPNWRHPNKQQPAAPLQHTEEFLREMQPTIARARAQVDKSTKRLLSSTRNQLQQRQPPQPAAEAAATAAPVAPAAAPAPVTPLAAPPAAPAMGDADAA